MFKGRMFLRSMVKSFVIAVLSLVIASAATAQILPEMRMTPAEIQASALESNQIGSSALPWVHTKVVFGDPAKIGFYTILSFVPAHTTIQTHTSRRSGGSCRLGRVALWLWHSFRCEVAEDASTG
jgi:hypothetical protein